jgi:O-antigen/teichoic acid export membrane protein
VRKDAGIRERAMLRGIASNYVALAAQAAWLVALTPLLVSRRGIDEFGAWTIALSVAGYLRLLDLGVGPTFARFIAADTSGERRSTLLASALAMLSGVGAVAALAGIAIGVVAPDLFSSQAEIGAAIAVAVVGSAIQVPLRVYGHLLYGLERLVERSAFTVLRLLASLAATVAGVLAGFSLPGYLAAAMGAEIVVSIAQAVYAVRRTGTRARPHDVDRTTIREITRFGAGTFGLQAATQIVYYSDALVIGVALGTAKAGVYAVAMRLVEGTSLLIGQASDAFMPRLARMHAGEQRADARALALTGAPWLVVTAAPAVAVLVALGGPIIALWIGGGHEDATLPLALLALGLAFNVPLRFPVLWALGAGRHHRIALIALAEALANVALSIVLVGPFGLPGVAAATLLTLAVSNGWVIPRLLARELGAPMWRWYQRPLLLAAAVAVPAGTLAALARDALGGDAATVGVMVVLAATVLAAGAAVARPRSAA